MNKKNIQRNPHDNFRLGGLATLVASYMARARGSGEPELSITRVKDLEQFCEIVGPSRWTMLMNTAPPKMV